MSRTGQVDIMVFSAHPDDAEIGVGGTIAKHSEAGFRVMLIDLTEAELSSNGDVQTRRSEAVKAAAILGAERKNLKIPDRGIELSRKYIDQLVQIIRTYKPKVVFAPFEVDRHPDHVLTSRLVETAVFDAKLRKHLPKLPAWQVPELLFYPIHEAPKCDIVIDVTDQHVKKQEALLAYRSQFDNVTNTDSTRVKTPLTNGYLQSVVGRDRLLAQPYDFEYAEGFIRRGAQRVNYFL